MKVIECIKKKTWVVRVMVLLAFCCAGNAAAQDENTWQFEATLYGWYTDIGGTAKHPGGVVPGGPFTVEASDILDNLDMVFMGSFEARKNKWLVITDAIYLDVGAGKSTTVTTQSGIPLNANVDLDLSAWILSGAVGYDVVQTDRVTFAVVGGVRYATIDVDITLGALGRQAVSSESEGLLDGIVGVRGYLTLNENWYLPYYADIGTGDSDLTWQALAGIGYRFSWGDIRLAYRYLSYDLDDGKHLEDLDVSGPILGVGFRF